MANRYVILDETGGWLQNVVIWDGNLETWQPPRGTVATSENEIDYRMLPVNPNLEEPISS